MSRIGTFRAIFGPGWGMPGQRHPRPDPTMFRYLAASLGPAACLVLGAAFGGWWTVAALVSMTGFVAGMDRLTRGEAGRGGWLGALPVTLAGVHIALWLLAVAALSGAWG